MIERSSHNINSPLDFQEGGTEISPKDLLFCINDFAGIEMKKIAKKYGLPPILVASIIRDFKKVERFLYSDSEGRA